MDKEIQIQNIYDEVIVHIPDTHYLLKGRNGIKCQSVLASDRDIVFSITHGFYKGCDAFYLLSWVGNSWYEKESRYLPAIIEAVRSNIDEWIVL